MTADGYCCTTHPPLANGYTSHLSSLAILKTQSDMAGKLNPDNIVSICARVMMKPRELISLVRSWWSKSIVAFEAFNNLCFTVI